MHSRSPDLTQLEGGQSCAARPQVQVAVRGTGPIHNIEIIKDNLYVYTVRPGVREISFGFRDTEAKPGESYYYVRIRQEDGQMAWASPIWVDYKP